MQPNNPRPDTNLNVPPRQSTPRDGSREAAANIVRGQIDALFEKQPATTNATSSSPADNRPQDHVPQQTPDAFEQQYAQTKNPYQKTHSERQHTIQKNNWQQYHSAWQNYYQQYYERYYVGQLYETKQKLEHDASLSKQTTDPQQVIGSNNVPEIEHGTMSKDEAIYDLRSRVRSTIRKNASQVRKSRHFVPIMSAVAVMLVFLFLQYNRIIFANVEAYIVPGTLDPESLIVSPSNTSVGTDPKLVIPKIAVDVPIVWDANASSQDSLNAAMDRGVAWFNIPGANAKPGEIGNFVVSGHSSNDWLDGGDYKFIFARLEQLQKGDNVYVNYNGTRYTYVVTTSQVVKPTDVSALQTNATKPTMTLITCVPLGTALNRLLVTAEQVDPDPAAATKTTDTSTSTNATKMPSNSPTFLQRIGNFFTGN